MFPIGLLSVDAQSGDESRTYAMNFLDALWNDKENENEVKAFKNNFMCQYWSRAPAMPSGGNFNPDGLQALQKDGHADLQLAVKTFQAYVIQGYLYFVNYIEFENRLRIYLDGINGQVTSLDKRVKNAEVWKKTCFDELGIQGSRLDSAHLQKQTSIELKHPGTKKSSTYSKDLQVHTLSPDKFFDLCVVMVACIYGRHNLAIKLRDDGTMKKDNFFYKCWIKEALTFDSYGRLLGLFSSFKVDELTADGASTKKWNEPFRTALGLEVEMFDRARDLLMQANPGASSDLTSVTVAS
ncbi:hypothetical protein AAF712_014976 [Marasmius tenuissimus]|uniref:Thiaminase-2/PQQC domain-containing protein n=1 Tax=Marasmius tenuissimus TaxID=585030 RepID=A0ABR2ZAW3_9AGAR